MLEFKQRQSLEPGGVTVSRWTKEVFHMNTEYDMMVFRHWISYYGQGPPTNQTKNKVIFFFERVSECSGGGGDTVGPGRVSVLRGNSWGRRCLPVQDRVTQRGRCPGNNNSRYSQKVPWSIQLGTSRLMPVRKLPHPGEGIRNNTASQRLGTVEIPALLRSIESTQSKS